MNIFWWKKNMFKSLKCIVSYVIATCLNMCFHRVPQIFWMFHYVLFNVSLDTQLKHLITRFFLGEIGWPICSFFPIPLALLPDADLLPCKYATAISSTYNRSSTSKQHIQQQFQIAHNHHIFISIIIKNKNISSKILVHHPCLNWFYVTRIQFNMTL